MIQAFKKIVNYISGTGNAIEPVACQLNSAEFSERRTYLLAHFTTAIQHVKSVNRGYAFTFKGNEETLQEVMKLVYMERKCCRFLKFQLQISNEQQPFSLLISGPRGTKKFLKGMLNLP